MSPAERQALYYQAVEEAHRLCLAAQEVEILDIDVSALYAARAQAWATLALAVRPESTR